MMSSLVSGSMTRIENVRAGRSRPRRRPSARRGPSRWPSVRPESAPFTTARGLAGIELEHHRLHRADRRRRHRQRAIAESRSAPSRRAACAPSRRRASPACRGREPASTIVLERAQHRRATARSKRVATRGLPRSAANRNCMRSLVPTETKSASSAAARRAARAATAPRSWRRPRAAVRQLVAVAAHSASARARPARGLRRTRRPSATIGNMILQLAARRRRASSARSWRAQQRRAVEAEADRPPAQRRVLLLARRAGRAAPCRRRCRACGRSPAVAGGVEHRAVERGLLARAAAAARRP